MPRNRPGGRRARRNEPMAVEWVKALEWRMARFDITVEEVLRDVKERGPHAASPINLSLPTLANLTAGWSHAQGAKHCDHCRQVLNLDDKEGIASAALFEAMQRFSVFVGRLMNALGDVADDGEPLPWVPGWAVEGYERFMRQWGKENQAAAQGRVRSNVAVGESDRLPSLDGVLFAGVNEEWMSRIVWNYLGTLIIEVGFRLEPRLVESEAIRILAVTIPERCVHRALEDGLWWDEFGVPTELVGGALRASQEALEAYLDHSGGTVLVPGRGYRSH